MTQIHKRIGAWFGRSTASPGQHRITLYSKADCHLCEEVHATLQQVRQEIAFDFEEIDITTDAALFERYGLKIPVVLIDGVERFWFRINERRLRRELA